MLWSTPTGQLWATGAWQSLFIFKPPNLIPVVKLPHKIWPDVTAGDVSCQCSWTSWAEANAGKHSDNECTSQAQSVPALTQWLFAPNTLVCLHLILLYRLCCCHWPFYELPLMFAFVIFKHLAKGLSGTVSVQLYSTNWTSVAGLCCRSARQISQRIP